MALDCNSFTAVTKAKLWCRNQATIYCAFILHFERVAHECLHRAPLQLPRQPQGTARQLAMIEAGGPVHECKPLGKFHGKSPLVFTAPSRLPVASPFIPPRRKLARDGFDYENGYVPLRGREQVHTKSRLDGSIQFIDRKRGDDRRVRRYV